jgi:predicted acylesterase/phospholipase RssA
MSDFRHYMSYLTQLFGDLSQKQLENVFSVSKVLHIETGDYIFQEGDEENSLYIVLTGRLRALHQTTEGIKLLGDISAGEPVGEFSLFTHEPRSASVIAIRKSTVLQIEESDYNELVKQNPRFAHTLTQFVIKRLRLNVFQQRMGHTPKNIAIVNLNPEFDISPWTTSARDQFGLMDTPINVYYAESLGNGNSYILFDELENHQGLNFLVCDNEDLLWANQCITYCDLVLVVGDFCDSEEIRPIESHLSLYSNGILNKKVYLILLHHENASLPSNTRRWFRDRPVILHLHIRKNNLKDIRRFCRIITNQAVGLVLGGGGAKGFAHIGMAKAMLEGGVEFDFIGGTSAGAMIGVLMSVVDFDMEEAIHLAKKGADLKPTSNDFHFPFLSLMTGSKMRKVFQDTFGEIYLEDIWINTFTVSTNYSTASLQIHDRGLARKRVEASIAIPGVFPPVIINKYLHVDGGVMDNLPIEAMYQKPVKYVIAVALSAQTSRVVKVENIPSSWQIFLNKFSKKTRFGLPTMSSILINSLTLNSIQRQVASKSQVSLYLEMELRNFGFLDWSKCQQLIDQGYIQTKDYLNKLTSKEQFWKGG